jgi:hypothetical protein
MMSRRTACLFGSLITVLLLVSPGWAAEDPAWPRETIVGGDRFVLHEPQVESWQDYAKLTGQVVVEVYRQGANQPILGSLSFTADTDVDTTNRTVSTADVRIVKTSFPDLDEQTAASLKQTLDSVLSEALAAESLDRMIAKVPATEGVQQPFKGATDPPAIFFSQSPAILVLMDGAPTLAPLGDIGLRFVLNTNWDIILDPQTSTYYLLDGDVWFATKDLLKGPWTLPQSLPDAFSKIPDDENWKPVREHLSRGNTSDVQVPKVFVSTKPAELILLDGEPKLEAIPDTKLSYVSNTDDDLFFSDSDQSYYFLTSGRWFKAKSLDGPWSWAGADLPDDFRKIPEDSAKADVLASVSGTSQAQEAFLQAQIPRKAEVKRSEAKLTVNYDGDPKFEPIQGTSLTYAVNTPSSVIQAGGKFYACENGVWFAAGNAQGPWVVADSVPDAIYKIPPTSPLYNTAYVHVYSSTPDAVTVGYTSGYLGTYPGDGTVLYGTGYYYPPYLGTGTVPVYFSRPWSYGFRASYDPDEATFDRGASWYGPHGGMGRSAVYDWTNRTYWRGSRAWGPYDSLWSRTAWNHPSSFVYGPSQHWNFYSHWGHRDSWNHWRDRFSRTGARHAFAAARSHSGDLYVGSSGGVFRRDGHGWSRWNGRAGWSAFASGEDGRNAWRHHPDELAGLHRAAHGRERGEKRIARHHKPPHPHARARAHHGGGHRGGGHHGGGHHGGGHRK